MRPGAAPAPPALGNGTERAIFEDLLSTQSKPTRAIKRLAPTSRPINFLPCWTSGGGATEEGPAQKYLGPKNRRLPLFTVGSFPEAFDMGEDENSSLMAKLMNGAWAGGAAAVKTPLPQPSTM